MMCDGSIREALRGLLDDLDAVQVCHAELTDTEVRERLSAAIFACFVSSPSRTLPKTFGMFSAQGDAMIHAALTRFLRHPEVIAARREMGTPQARLEAFQDEEATSSEGNDYASYFGYRAPPTLPYQLG